MRALALVADRLDADLHLAFTRRGRRRQLGQFKLAVGNKSERTHFFGWLRGSGRGAVAIAAGQAAVNPWKDQAGSPVSTRQTFCPPKPKEFEITRRTLASRALLGTTSSGIAGSGIS